MGLALVAILWPPDVPFIQRHLNTTLLFIYVIVNSSMGDGNPFDLGDVLLLPSNSSITRLDLSSVTV